MDTFRTNMGSGGRIVIPAQLRTALGMKPGDEVFIALADGELRIFSLEHAIRRAQKAVRHYVPKGRSLAQDLIQDRRLEGTKE